MSEDAIAAVVQRHLRRSGAAAAIVARLRETYQAKGASRQFNKLRDAASAFLKGTLTRRHPLYLAVRATVGFLVGQPWSTREMMQ